MNIRAISPEVTWPHRQKVMYPELTVEDMILEKDHEGFHFGLFIEEKLTTAISLFFENDEMQFRKLATLHSQQGKGYGSAMLNHAFKLAGEKKIKRVWCNSRVSACSLYEKFGMIKTHHTYTKHGIDFVVMEKFIA